MKTPEQLQAELSELAQKWLAEISRVRGKESTWRDKSKKVVRRYRDDRENDDRDEKYNILWSNTEVIRPAIFARMPIPDVRRRWATKDPAGRTAALILERALTFVNSTYNLKDVFDRCVEDYILPGRCQAVVCYEPIFASKQVRVAVEPLPPSQPNDDSEQEEQYPEGTQFDNQGAYQMQPQEYKAWETVYIDYVPWELFGFSECSTWDKVPAIWTGEYLYKEDIERIAPNFIDYEGLSFNGGTDVETQRRDNTQPPQTVLVWKVWHKATRKFMIFAENYDKAPLLIADDPLQLEKFYQTPEPMYSIRNNGSWMPKPEYLLYQDQARELDEIAERRRKLIARMRDVGVYDQAMDEKAKVSELPKKADGTYIPIPDYRALAEKGGLESIFSSLPIEEPARVLEQLNARAVELKQEIFELCGISDIMRGSTAASETLGAQQLKAQFGSLRISTRQQRFQQFVRDLYKIQAEIIAEHFDPVTLRLMTGIQVLPDLQYQQLKQQKQLESGMVSETEFNQAIQIIKSDKLRGFSVDIETDSTIPVDVAQQQQGRMDFITALGTYLQGVIPAVQSGAVPIAVAREAVLFVVRGFKIGTELEEVLEQLGDDQGPDVQQLTQMVQQLQEQLKALQQENQQLRQTWQLEAQKKGSEMQTDQARAANDIQIDRAQAANDMQLDTIKTMQDMAQKAVRPK